MPGFLTLPHARLQRRALFASLAALSAPGSIASCKPIRIPLVPGGLLVREVQGKAQGVLADLVAAIQQRLSCKVQSELLPQGRLIRSFYETFDADVLLPGSPVSFDGHTPHFVPMFKVTAHFVGRSASAFDAAKVATLLAQDWHCVLPRSVSYGSDFDTLVAQLDTQGRVTWVRDVGTALRMVAAGRVDFTLLSPTVTYAYGGESFYRTFQFLALPALRPMETGAAVSRRSLPESAQARVVAALHSVVRDGEVVQAFKRHFPAEVLALESPALLKA